MFFGRFRKKGYHNIHISEYTIHSRNADKGLNVRTFHSYISLTVHLHAIFYVKIVGLGCCSPLDISLRERALSCIVHMMFQ